MSIPSYCHIVWNTKLQMISRPCCIPHINAAFACHSSAICSNILKCYVGSFLFQEVPHRLKSVISP